MVAKAKNADFFHGLPLPCFHPPKLRILIGYWCIRIAVLATKTTDLVFSGPSPVPPLHICQVRPAVFFRFEPSGKIQKALALENVRFHLR